ncbi:MAG TPA: hypothetical protein VMT58_06250, partial [Candidatus Binataceae bacterium]|nr:hypothetical protein [Candidatus Binataceae bacterium]
LASLFLEFYKAPRCGEVYNLGGGRANSMSILETIAALKRMGLNLNYNYRDEARIGDHICYISDLTKVRSHFPNWRVEYDLSRTMAEIVDQNRPRSESSVAGGGQPGARR